MKEKAKLAVLLVLLGVAGYLFNAQIIKAEKISGCTSGIMGFFELNYGPAPSEAIRKIFEGRVNMLCREFSAKGKL